MGGGGGLKEKEAYKFHPSERRAYKRGRGLLERGLNIGFTVMANISANKISLPQSQGKIL